MELEEKHTEQVTYIGRRITNSNTLKPFYRGEDGSEYGMVKPLAPGLRVGAILEVHTSNEGKSIVTGGPDAPRVVGQAPESDCMKWAAREAVAVTLHGKVLEDKRVKDGLRDPLREHLEAIRAAYRTLPHGFGGVGQRAAFIDYVTTAIQS
jgi:hypothetical protein